MARTKISPDPTSLRLRREVEKLGPRGPGQRFPEPLKRELCEAAATLRGRGASWQSVADCLGLGMETARRFGESVLSMGASIRAVAVVDEAPDRAVIRIVSPSGWTIEVGSRAEAVALLRELT